MILNAMVGIHIIKNIRGRCDMSYEEIIADLSSDCNEVGCKGPASCVHIIIVGLTK